MNGGRALEAYPTGDLVLRGDFTIRCWVQPAGDLSASGLFSVGNGFSGAGVAVAAMWPRSMVDGTSTLARVAGVPIKVPMAFGADKLAAGTWYHVALVRSGSTVYGVVRGSVGGITQGISTEGWGIAVGDMKQDAGYSAVLSVLGLIDDFQIITGAAITAVPNESSLN